MASSSIISIAPGTTPLVTISPTVSPAARVESKNATSVLTVSGTGTTRSHAFVATPGGPPGPAHAYPPIRRDAECALGADERAEQFIARRIDLSASEPDHLAVGQHDLQATD